MRFTDRNPEDNRVVFNIDDGLDQDLFRYCEKICMENCGSTFNPECGDCHVTRLYYAMLYLAEYEDTGLTPEEVATIKTKLAEAQRRERAAVEELDNAQPCFACTGFRRNGGKCFGAGACRVRDMAIFHGVEYNDLAHGESWRWRGPAKEAG